MVSTETANQWVQGVYADDRLKAILDEVEQTYGNIDVAIVDGPEWESTVKGGRAIIRLADTSRPYSAFAHELLHLRLSARGYRHILGSGNHDPEKNKVISDLLSALDNELQHHRMFPAFESAGFDGGDFYAESDDAASGAMQLGIEALTDKHPPSFVLFSYLTLIAPGGRWPDGRREALVELLRTKVSPETWDKLLTIKATIEAWSKLDTLDPIETIVSIFETLGDLDGTFIAENVSSHPLGAFIPRSLTKDQFKRLTDL